MGEGRKEPAPFESVCRNGFGFPSTCTSAEGARCVPTQGLSHGIASHSPAKEG